MSSSALPLSTPKPTPPNLGYAICNLRDVAQIRQKVRKVADFFGGHIDTLINYGGIAAPYWKDGKTMEDPETLD
jgi:ribonuclease Z